jgi:ABC-type dipeptide/oligopeptide/nickel transport system ATPase component
VSFQTRGAEKVGIVGRTGSGKSSIFQALYRLAEIDRKGNKSPISLILASCLAVLRIRDVYPGFRIKMIPDPGSGST